MRSQIMTVDDDFFSRPESEAWSDLSPKSCNGQAKFIDTGVADRFCRTVRAANAGQILTGPTQCTESGSAVQHVLSNGGVDIAMELTPKLSTNGRSCELTWRLELSRPVESAIKSFSSLATKSGKPNEVPAQPIQVINSSATIIHQCELGVTMPLGRSVLYYICTDDAQPGKRHYAVVLSPELSQNLPPAAPQ